MKMKILNFFFPNIPELTFPNQKQKRQQIYSQNWAKIFSEKRECIENHINIYIFLNVVFYLKSCVFWRSLLLWPATRNRPTIRVGSVVIRKRYRKEKAVMFMKVTSWKCRRSGTIGKTTDARLLQRRAVRLKNDESR